MTKRKPYEILYDDEVAGHMAAIDKKYHSLVRREIENQLTYEPDKETLNKGPLEKPSILGIAWRLRFGPDNTLRVYYRFDAVIHEVYILAVGIKAKNRLYLGGKEFQI